MFAESFALVMLHMSEVNFNQLLKFNGQDIIKIKITTQVQSIKIVNLAQVRIPRCTKFPTSVLASRYCTD